MVPAREFGRAGAREGEGASTQWVGGRWLRARPPAAPMGRMGPVGSQASLVMEAALSTEAPAAFPGW